MRRNINTSVADVVINRTIGQQQRLKFAASGVALQQQRFEEFWKQHGLPGQAQPNYAPGTPAPDLYKTPVGRGTGTSITEDPYQRSLPNVHLSPPISTVSTSENSTADTTMEKRREWAPEKLANHWANLSEWFSESEGEQSSPLILTYIAKLRVNLRAAAGSTLKVLLQPGVEIEAIDFASASGQQFQEALNANPELKDLDAALRAAVQDISVFDRAGFVMKVTAVLKSNSAAQKFSSAGASLADNEQLRVHVAAVLYKVCQERNDVVAQLESHVKDNLGSVSPGLWSKFFALVETHWDSLFIPEGVPKESYIEGGTIHPSPSDPRLHSATNSTKALWTQARGGAHGKRPPLLKPSAALYFFQVLTSAGRSGNGSRGSREDNLRGLGGRLNTLESLVNKENNLAVSSLSVDSSIFDSKFSSGSDSAGNGSASADARAFVNHHRKNLLRAVGSSNNEPASAVKSATAILDAAKSIPNFPRKVLESLELLKAVQSISGDSLMRHPILLDFVSDVAGGNSGDGQQLIKFLLDDPNTEIQSTVRRIMRVGAKGDNEKGNDIGWIFSASSRWNSSSSERKALLLEVLTTQQLVEALHKAGKQLWDTSAKKRSAVWKDKFPAVRKLVEEEHQRKETATENALRTMDNTPDVLPIVHLLEMSLGVSYLSNKSKGSKEKRTANSSVQIDEKLLAREISAEVEKKHPAWTSSSVFQAADDSDAMLGQVEFVPQLENLVRIYVRLTVPPHTAKAVLNQRFQRRIGPIGSGPHQHNVPVEVGQAEHTNNQEYKQYDWQGWYQRMWDIHLRNVTMRVRLSDMKGQVANDGLPLLDMQGERRLRILSGDRVGAGVIKLDTDRYEDKEHNYEHGNFKLQQLISESRKTILGKEYWPTVEVKVRKPSGQSKMHYSTLDWDRVEEEASSNYKKYVEQKKTTISVQPQDVWLEAPDENKIYPSAAAQSPAALTSGDATAETSTASSTSSPGADMMINPEDLFNELS